MSIRIGIYDFFTYTIPGIIYLSVIIYYLYLFNIIQNNYQIKDINILHLFIVAALSFILGIIFDPIANKFWYHLFSKENHSEVAIREMQKRYPELNITLQPNHWPIILAFIANKRTELADDIHKVNAQSKMMRNISFGLMLFGIVFILHFFLKAPNPSFIIGAIMFILFSIISILQAKKFDIMFYLLIYETVISYQFEMKNYINFIDKSKK